MPNIPISGLPPVSLPIDDANSFLEVSVIEAGEEVSRKISVDEIAGATGLDATFLTLSVNAQLPNERVLTEGTNITFVDTGPGGTLTINAASGLTFPILAPDGSAVAPSYSFTNDPGAGMFLNALGELSLAADGVEILRAINGANNQVAIAQSGSTSVPDLTSLADLDTGFRWDGSNETIWMGGGSRAWNFSTVKFFSQFSNGGALFNRVAQRDVPTLVPDHSDSNTGVGGQNDEVTLIAGGIEGVRVDETGSAIQVIIDPGLTNTSDATPPLAFGGGTVGFRSPDSDQIFAILSGSSIWHFTTVDFHANITDGPALRFVNPSDTVPSLLPNFNDTDTGIGTVTPDAINLIAGGAEALELVEVGGQVLQINLPETGITASTTQTQGERPLISSYNEVSIVANTNDTVTAPGARAGIRLQIINNGGNTLQVFPAAGDNIGAGVDTAITIDSGEVGIFIGRDNTNWDDLFTGSPGGLTFPLQGPDGTAATPSYSFTGDTDTGMFLSGPDILAFSARATEMLQVVGALGANQVIVAPGAIQNNLSAPDLALGDGDTGIMQTVDNTLAIVTGANQAVRWAEASASIIQTNSSDVGLTASVTQTQAGGLVLLSSYNEVSTVATTGDALTAMDVFQGHRLYVLNNGVNDLQLFPAVGDDFGAGVDTAITIAAGNIGIFLGRDSINWDVLYNNGASPGVSFPLLAPDGSAAAPSYSFSGDTDMGMFRLGAFLAFTVGGTAQWVIDGTALSGVVGSAPLFRNIAASSTVPNITISSSDINTGLGTAGADILSLIAGGVEIARATEVVGANQFAVVASGASTVPDLTGLADPDTGLQWNGLNQLIFIGGGTRAWNWTTAQFFSQFSNGPAVINAAAAALSPKFVANRQDLDTGIGWPSDDVLEFIAGGVEAVRYAEASSRVIQTNANHVGLTASVTQTQAGGLALLSSYNEVSVVANPGDAITAFGVTEGERLIVVNNGANTLQLFPASGDDIGAGVDASIEMLAGNVAVFIGRNATSWDTLFNSNPNIEFPGGASISSVWSFDSTTTEADPGAGNFRNDNATIASVTEVFISSETEIGADADNILGLLGNGDQLYIQNVEDATEFMVFDITANVDNGGWFSLAGTVAASNANFTDGEKFGVLLLFGGTGAPAVPVANDAAQARRTTNYDLTTAFVDITMDTTDIETDSAVIDHDLVTNTDNIIFGAAGTYEVTYDFDVICEAVAGDPIIDMGCRVRLNDAGTGIAGSLANPYVFRDGSVGGDDGNVQKHISNTFIVTVSATDFITLQLDKTELSGTAVFAVSKICVKARRLL